MLGEKEVHLVNLNEVRDHSAYISVESERFKSS